MIKQNNKILVSLIFLSLFLAAADTTIMGTILPTIKNIYHDPSLYPWLISGFILSSIISMPIFGILADNYGDKKILILSIIIFMISSILIIFSSTMISLVFFRIIQGIGSGGIMVLVYVAIARIFPPEKRGKMQGTLSSIWGLSAIIGPLIGALSQQIYTWKIAFIINIPLALILILGFIIYYKPSKKAEKNKMSFDSLGFIIFSLLITSFLMLIINNSYIETYTNYIISIFILSIIAFSVTVIKKKEIFFIAYEFFYKKHKYALVTILISSIILYATITIFPIIIFDTMNKSVIISGVVVLLGSLGWVIGSIVCGNNINKWEAKKSTLIGFILLLIGIALCFILQYKFYISLICLIEFILGLGMGFVGTATLVFSQNNTSKYRLGKITSGVQMLRNVGASIGVNLIAGIYIKQHVVSPEQSFTIMFTILFLLLVIGTIFSLKLNSNNVANYN